MSDGGAGVRPRVQADNGASGRTSSARLLQFPAAATDEWLGGTRHPNDRQAQGDEHVPHSILIAEDSFTQRELLRADLEQAGYRVTVAADGEQAFDELTGQRFDLLLSDVVMPGVTGHELCRKAKELDPTLPVLMLTSLSDPLDVVRGLQAGADNFLRKPYVADQLLGRIQTILYNRQLRERGQTQMGLELFFLNQRFMITAERQQILDVLVSTFEELVETNERLREREDELARAHDELGRQLSAAEAERRRLNGVLAALPDVMVTIDREGTVTGASDGATEFLGAASPGDLCGRHIWDVIDFVDGDGHSMPVEERPLHRALVTGETSERGGFFDVLCQRSDGSRVPVVVRGAPLRDAAGTITGAVGVLHEVGALAAHDPLTQLPTQVGFATRVNLAVQRAAERGRCAAVLLITLDRAQRIRDSLGHSGSDELVAAVARRLQGVLAEAERDRSCVEASAAYLGNQEYAVVLGNLEDETEAVRIAQLLVDRVGAIYTVEGIDLPLTLSVGVALPTGTSADVMDLVPAAATAARTAAQAGGNRVAVSNPETSRRAFERLHEESDLRSAIEGGQLRVLYQPQLCVATGKVTGMEALVRWQHPERGLLSPGAFIPLAEDSGLIVPLGSWVLQEACRQMAIWRRLVPAARSWTMSVNLSPQQLASDDVTEIVRHALAESRLDPSALQLEITETGVMADPAAVKERLSAIKALGASVAIDDFGTGYSSLLQLRRFPIDVLKIDRTFVGGMVTDEEDAAIVAATVRLGQSLGLRLVAEGVETVDQLARLRILECDYAQGYHWAAPLHADDFLRWAKRSAALAEADGNAPASSQAAATSRG